jgi:DNA-binding transcriptional MerR regulator
VTNEFTLEELAQAVQSWCENHRIYPANGQAAEEMSERTIRYYRTLGLLDPPAGSYAKTFSEKHRLQLIAIRLYQAQGLPLRKIRDELYGKDLEDLIALERQAAKRGKKGLTIALPFLPSPGNECWRVVMLADEFLLVSRQNRLLPRSVIEKINRLIAATRPESEITNESSKN